MTFPYEDIISVDDSAEDGLNTGVFETRIPFPCKIGLIEPLEGVKEVEWSASLEGMNEGGRITSPNTKLSETTLVCSQIESFLLPTLWR